MNYSILKKWISFSFLCFSFVGMHLYADANSYKNWDDMVKIKTRTKFEKGWWWYEEIYKNKETNKTKIIRYRLSPQEKAKLEAQKKQNELLRIIAIELKQNQKLQEKILDRLNYAFPNVTPKYTINRKTGEKCLTNSSADCFVMPVTAEGQHIPVLKRFLRNPSPKNSAEWLKWQAVYFDHIRQISNGLRFAYLQGGGEVYPVATDYTYGDSVIFPISDTLRKARVAQQILKLKNRIAYLIFIGQNKNQELNTHFYINMAQAQTSFLKYMNIIYIFPSKKSEEWFKNYVLNYLKERGYINPYKYFTSDNVRFTIRPDLYKYYNVRVTPSVVLFYKKDKKSKPIWQTILVGRVSPDAIRSATRAFLEYYSIIPQAAYTEDKNLNVISNVPQGMKKIDKEYFSPRAPRNWKKYKYLENE